MVSLVTGHSPLGNKNHPRYFLLSLSYHSIYSFVSKRKQNKKNRKKDRKREKKINKERIRERGEKEKEEKRGKF